MQQENIRIAAIHNWERSYKCMGMLQEIIKIAAIKIVNADIKVGNAQGLQEFISKQEII